MSILITGGAGFVGSSLAVYLKESGYGEVTCVDNLKRRGSELTLPRLKRHGIRFIHGDVRNRDDFTCLPPADVLIECSAEPSVLAGYGGSPIYLLDCNLGGAINCIEWARRCRAMVIFLSTSRVYPYDRLQHLPLAVGERRFIWDGASVEGAGPDGVAETFPLNGARSLYGATKLAAELVLAEYGDAYGLPYVINRCGVITGPWQFGKTDQGIFMYWLLNHYFNRPLSYIGYGGEGNQVRDLMHVHDLADLIKIQLTNLSACNGKTYNIGGGKGISLSLKETTGLCRELTGCQVAMTSIKETRPADIPWYITDAGLAAGELGWQPRRGPRSILADMLDWIKCHEEQLVSALEQ
jgi:CDP-paratose 2-epimerase